MKLNQIYTQDKYRWNMLVLTVFSFVVYGVVYQNIPPILGRLIEYFSISYTQAGTLMTLFTLPGILLSIPGGVLIDKYGSKKLGIISLSLMLLGSLIVAISGSYWIILLGRLITGFGGAVLVVVLPQIITVWFYDREIGFAMGMFNIAMPLGTVLAFKYIGTMAQSISLRSTLWLSFGLIAFTMMLFLFAYRDRKGVEKEDKINTDFLTVFKGIGLGIWLISFTWGFFQAGIISYLTYASDYFISKGFTISEAGSLAGYPMLGALFISPAVGFFLDRIGQKKLFIAAGCFGCSVSVFLIPIYDNYTVFLSVCLGFSVALVAPAIFAYPVEFLAKDKLGIGFGILATIAEIGMALGPLVNGFLRELTGDYSLTFIAMMFFFILGGLVILFLNKNLS